MSGSQNNCNGAEGIHNFGDLCKYGHIRQAKGGTRASPGTHPTLETNKQTFSMKQYTLETLAAANGGHILSLMTLAGHSLDPHFLLNKKKCTVILEKKLRKRCKKLRLSLSLKTVTKYLITVAFPFFCKGEHLGNTGFENSSLKIH